MLDLGLVGWVANGTVDGEASLQQLLDEDASDVSGGTGDHHGRRGRYFHCFCLSLIFWLLYVVEEKEPTGIVDIRLSTW